MESSQSQGRHRSPLYGGMSLLLRVNAQTSPGVFPMQQHAYFKERKLMSLLLLMKALLCHINACQCRRPCMACCPCPVTFSKLTALVKEYITYRGGICAPRERWQQPPEALRKRSDLQDSCAMRQNRRCEGHREIPQVLPVIQIPHYALHPAITFKDTPGQHGYLWKWVLGAQS